MSGSPAVGPVLDAAGSSTPMVVCWDDCACDRPVQPESRTRLATKNAIASLVLGLNLPNDMLFSPLDGGCPRETGKPRACETRNPIGLLGEEALGVRWCAGSAGRGPPGISHQR